LLLSLLCRCLCSVFCLPPRTATNARVPHPSSTLRWVGCKPQDRHVLSLPLPLPSPLPLPLPFWLSSPQGICFRPCLSSTSHNKTCAPSIAHFATGVMEVLTQPHTPLLFWLLPALLSILFTPTRNRHFDRSCSQSHREQRSGEIRFSASTFPHHHGALCPAFPSTPKSLILNAAKSPAFCCLKIIFLRFPPKNRTSSPETT
jgi:hypothetical protein